MKKLFYLLLIAVPVIVGLQSFDRTDSAPTIQADTVCFTRDILPIINSNCAQSGCHDAISHKDNLNLTTYSGIMKAVKAGSPSTSSLYRQISNNQMPQYPYSRLSDTMKTLINLWITQGAKNTTCTTTNCDTVNVTYEGTIKPIITFNCMGCHGGASPDGGVDLTNDEVVDANKERILCCVSRPTDCALMPKNNINLTSCQIAQIRTWVNGVQSSVNNNDPLIEYLTVTPTILNESGKISFSIQHDERVIISLFGYDGREIKRVANDMYSAGKHEVTLQAGGLQQGVYFVRLRTGNAVRSAMFVR